MGRVLVCLSCSELLFFCFWFLFALSCNCLHHCLVTKKMKELTGFCVLNELMSAEMVNCVSQLHQRALTLNDGQAV